MCALLFKKKCECNIVQEGLQEGQAALLAALLATADVEQSKAL
jgi:hypothetical protein